MKAREINLLDFMEKAVQFLIPIYQRTYSWGERECNQIWEDILQAGRNDNISAHFIGSIVSVRDAELESTLPCLVIDGQQRLTTIMLIIEALSRRLGEHESLNGFSSQILRSRYLLNNQLEGEQRYKLVLSQTDKHSMFALFDQKDPPKGFSMRVEENFDLFTDKVSTDQKDILALCKGLSKLVIVDISLDREQDNPQLIFESLNSTGKELGQADLIRNYILMGLEPDVQALFYNRYWRPMEIEFGQENYETHFDGFMRHYLTLKTGEIPNVHDVYDAFKKFARSKKNTGLTALISEIKKYAGFYCAMALGGEPDPDLRSAFQDIRELKMDVAYPLLLELYSDYIQNLLNKDDFLEALRLIESYVFRRSVCNIPTNSLNKVFPGFSQNLNKTRYLDGIKGAFLRLSSYRRFPNDSEFMRWLQIKDLYNFPRRNYWIRRLENQHGKSPLSIEQYRIEHVIPDNENLPEVWMRELGPEWERIQRTYLHTIGNLTLVDYNPIFSENSYTEKREMKGGLGQDQLGLNKEFRLSQQWNEKLILQRSARLSKLALEVWLVPVLGKRLISQLLPKTQSLKRGNKDVLMELLVALTKEITTIDPAIEKEFQRTFVTLKKENHLLSLIPVERHFQLFLNIPYSKLEDSLGKCVQVTPPDSAIHGNVRVLYISLDELPYIMGLVRQSLELQMSNTGDGN